MNCEAPAGGRLHEIWASPDLATRPQPTNHSPQKGTTAPQRAHRPIPLSSEQHLQQNVGLGPGLADPYPTPFLFLGVWYDGDQHCHALQVAQLNCRADHRCYVILVNGKVWRQAGSRNLRATTEVTKPEVYSAHPAFVDQVRKSLNHFPSPNQLPLFCSGAPGGDLPLSVKKQNVIADMISRHFPALPLGGKTQSCSGGS
jgi:hypothetical protein